MIASLFDAASAADVLLQEAFVEVGLLAVGALVDGARRAVHTLHMGLQDLLQLEDLVASGALVAP